MSDMRATIRPTTPTERSPWVPRGLAVLRLALVLVLACALAPPATATEPATVGVPATCFDKQATTTSPTGTEGDDVMVVAVSAGVTVQGLGGDDTICLVPGGGAGGRDPLWFADSGPGNDLVTNESGHIVSVRLGAGADRYVGTDSVSNVYTGEESSGAGVSSYFGQTDADRDVVTAGTPRDSVYSGDTTRTMDNPDQITTAAGPNRVFFAGTQGGDGFLDDGVGRGDLIVQVGAWPGEHLQLDLRAGTASVDGRTTLAWTGASGLVFDTYRPRALTYRGGSGDEDVTMSDGDLFQGGPAMLVDVRAGAGSDVLTLPGRVRGRVAMGRGADTVVLSPGCREMTGSPRRLQCAWGSGSARLHSRGVERWRLSADAVRFRGTRGSDRIDVSARRGILKGMAGDDVLGFTGHGGVIDGGAGHDRCSAQSTRHCERH